MPIFGLRSATKAAAAPAEETEDERLAREAEEERLRLQAEADKGSSYTSKGKKSRKALMDEAGDI